MRSRMPGARWDTGRETQRQRDRAIARYMHEIEVHAWFTRVKDAIEEGIAGLGHPRATWHGFHARAVRLTKSFKKGLSWLAQAFDGRAWMERVHGRGFKGETSVLSLDDPNACVTKGLINLRAGDIAGAIGWFAAASTLDPGWVMPLYMLARAFNDKGDAGHALEYCTKALQVDPGLDIARDLASSIEARRGSLGRLFRHAKHAAKRTVPENGAIT